MPWAKVDDTLHSHPKANRVGLPALGLHLLALSYASHYLTDGVLDAEWIEQKARGRYRDLPNKLVDAGLWERSGDGYVIHDFLDFNPSAEQVQNERRSSAERMAKLRRNGARTRGGRR